MTLLMNKFNEFPRIKKRFASQFGRYFLITGKVWWEQHEKVNFASMVKKQKEVCVLSIMYLLDVCTFLVTLLF